MGGDITFESLEAIDDLTVIAHATAPDVVDDGFNIVFEGVLMMCWNGFQNRRTDTFSIWHRMLKWIALIESRPFASSEEKTKAQSLKRKMLTSERFDLQIQLTNIGSSNTRGSFSILSNGTTLVPKFAMAGARTHGVSATSHFECSLIKGNWSTKFIKETLPKTIVVGFDGQQKLG
ncbi:MAG: hypothetical protein WBC85_04000 [Planktotalea sp.]|uniref:hypothetical protein n=1 Tax=Planktotalea sp. TaxID=2029877 RepID=UPI003C745FC6